MRIKLDENIPCVVRELLVPLGHDVDSVQDEDLTGQPDAIIWHAAQRNQRALITQDLGFSDLRLFPLGSHWGIVLVRLQEPSRADIIRRLTTAFSSEGAEDWSRCLVVVTEQKVRVIRPGQTERPGKPSHP